MVGRAVQPAAVAEPDEGQAVGVVVDGRGDDPPTAKVADRVPPVEDGDRHPPVGVGDNDSGHDATGANVALATLRRRP